MDPLVRATLTVLVIVFFGGMLVPLSATPRDEPITESKPFLGSSFAFRDPVSLFFPTATISLTDDNSTFFNAKPAAFGPSLPPNGISAPIWIGIGFRNSRDHYGTEEGEEGCDDALGTERSHWPLPKGYALPGEAMSITSDEEALDIKGKVALLSRGGCGFSEKVQWAQQRGAIAVIIGDNVPGGPLVRMYPRGDTSNISIPSIFTSHTTAHLLSSLMPSNSEYSNLDAFNGKYIRSDGGSSDTSVSDESGSGIYDMSNLFDTHDGLWVTLTQAEMSASPFFNTLFVLVVSPLITLAIVYSMLLLRSRIRRRRWRAPKSVVERLPVRVYHNLSSHGSPAVGTPTQEHITCTTPLLNSSQSAPVEAGQNRQLSRDTESSLQASSMYGSLDPASGEKEAVDPGLAEWRRRFSGRQRECVVCLDEYVDGVSRVMSLPCGHEFHVDCITPWLTTRRRTCPICKGDVVRSLERNSDTSSREPGEETEEDVQVQAAETVNSSPSAALPIPQLHRINSSDSQRNTHSGSMFSSFGSPPLWSSRQGRGRAMNRDRQSSNGSQGN